MDRSVAVRASAPRPMTFASPPWAARRLVNEVVTGCQQFHGGMGYMRGTVIERLWRDARVLAIGGGATEVMLDEVAKRY
ncbi:MAG: acyl-CoA dehydrogenase family protein [Caldimonas sp.]